MQVLKTSFTPISLLFSLLFAATSPCQAQFERILGPTPITWTFFGNSVAMHDRLAAVGEPATDGLSGPQQEKVHIYWLDFDGWKHIQTFTSTGNVFNETLMGGRMSMSSKWLAFTQIVTASTWKLHLYQRQADTFAFKQIINFPSPHNEEAVCKTVALSDDHLIVGGNRSAYFYRPDSTGTWVLQQTITKSGAGQGAFGSSAALWENRAVICSNLENCAYTYRFDGNTWVEVKRLVPADVDNHNFGSNCAIYKDLVAVTDFGYSYNTTADTSKAYLYQWNTNNTIAQIAALKSPTLDDWSNFGGSYLFTDDFVLIGANTDYERGKVFKFRRQGNQFQYARSYGTGEYFSAFGESQAMSNNQWMVGDVHVGNLRGAVYHGFVYDTVYALLECQLPANVQGNLVTDTNFYQVFQPDSAGLASGAPRKFGVMNVDRLFRDAEPVMACFLTETPEPQAIDVLQGYSLLMAPNQYVAWTGTFEHNGQVFTAADVLDNVNVLRPKIVHPLPMSMHFQVNFGNVGEAPCASYPVQVDVVYNYCPDDTTRMTLIEGDTLTLTNNCVNLTPDWGSSFWNAFYPGSNDDIESAFEPSTRVWPLVSTLFRYSIISTASGCAVSNYYAVDVVRVDDDNDGFPDYLDCDDTNPNINPGGVDLPLNGIDEDCAAGDDGYCFVRRHDALSGKDVMLRESLPGANESDTENLDVSSWYSSGTIKKQRSLVQFNLGVIPPEGIVDSAFLSLYHNPDDLLGPLGNQHIGVNFYLSIERATASWASDNIKWINQPPSTLENQVLVPRAGILGNGNFLHMNVTNLVRDLVDPSKGGNHGFMLKVSPEGNNFSKQLIFASSNHQNPALRPKLDVCWRLPSSAVADAQHQESGFAVYPNPGTDEVLVERTNEKPAWLQVFASDGRLVQTHRLSGLRDRMAVGNLPKGLYFFRLETGGWVKWVRG